MPNQNDYPVYAYDILGKDFRRFMSGTEWGKQMTFEGAKDYLRDHLKRALFNDFSLAMQIYVENSIKTKVGKGFFGSVRILFPTIDFLGTLYKGKENSKSDIAFMEEYLGRVNATYKKS